MCVFVYECLCIGGNKLVVKIKVDMCGKSKVWYKFLDVFIM